VFVKKSFIREFALVVPIFVLACAQGYYFGGGDLALYVPLVMQLHDPAIFANDLLMQSLGAYAAPIWQTAAWLLNFFDVRSVFLLLFLFQTAVIILGVRVFYQRLFGDRGWVIFLLMLVVERSSGAMNTFGLNPFGYFQPGGLAFGMILIMYAALDAGKWKTAGVIAGTMFLYHPFTALWACMLFGFRAIIVRDMAPLKNKITGAVLLAICGAPYFYIFLHNIPATPQWGITNALWIELAKMRLNHTFFLSRWVPDRFIQFGLIFGAIGLFHRHPSFKRTLPIVIATATAFAIIAFAEIISSKMLLQLNLARCMYLLWVLFFAFVSSRIAATAVSGSRWRDVLWVLLALLLMIYPFVEHHRTVLAYAVIIMALAGAAAVAVWRTVNVMRLAVAFGFVLVIVVSVSRVYDQLKTFRNLSGVTSEDPWFKTQVWVRDHVATGQCLLTPSYIEGFRSNSLHPIYGDYKDGGSHIFCPSTTGEWWKRMQALGITLGMSGSAFPRAYSERVLAVARKTQIRYIVIDKQFTTCIGAPLYENEKFAVVLADSSVHLAQRYEATKK
jgi:hypothetical protein